MSDDLHSEKYPTDVPNSKCQYALVRGLLIGNSFKASVGDFSPLFENKNEKIFLWTYKNSNDSDTLLVSKVEPEIKAKPFWKTVGSLINLSMAYTDSFEDVSFESQLKYYWIYYFSEHTPISDLVFYNPDPPWYSPMQKIIKLTKLFHIAPIIELLDRDDRAYTAVSLLLSSFQIHYSCLICEVGLSPAKKHESHEPELWEQAECITGMESAIVQACRCAESILGELPNKNKQNRILSHKQQWIKLVGIDPDSKYDRAETSYWNFYEMLFDKLRNPSAHSYGNIHFDLERKRTIDAQCFAALILKGYIDKNVKTDKEALDALHFNRKLLSQVNDMW